jgi:hypothetical protein
MFRDMRESVYDIYRSIKKCLDQIDGNPYAEEAMYMNMTYALAFRLMSNGNWEKNELKRWMGERVEDATETLLELEAEENSLH